MLVYQSFTIECGDHSFNYDLSHETASLIINRDFKGRIEGIVCPVCDKVLALDVRALFETRRKAEDEVAAEALEEITEELRKGGKKKKLEETQHLYRKRVEKKVKDRGPLALEKKHVHETPDARVSA
jgi:uncharacterized Zn finger protein (UPF0148 family)